MKNKNYLLLLFASIGLINLFCSSAGNFLSTRSIPVGYETTFSMDADRRSGYEWEVTQNSDPLVLGYVSKEFTDNGDGKGKETLKFKGLKKGTAEIIISYVNKSLSGNKVYKTQTFSVTVR